MPFGLCNAFATFEKLMKNVLRGLSWKICLDDIILIGKTFEDHLKNLEELFRRLLGSNLTLNPKKYSLSLRKTFGNQEDSRECCIACNNAKN